MTLLVFLVLCGMAVCFVFFLCFYDRHAQYEYMMKRRISLYGLCEVGSDIVRDRNENGQYPEYISDDLCTLPDQHFRLRLQYLMGKTTGESVPEGMAPANIVGPTWFTLYSVPEFDKNTLFKVTPSGVYSRKRNEPEEVWHLERRLYATPALSRELVRDRSEFVQDATA